MNEIKMIDTEVKLSDLRRLGRQGYVTLRLNDGSTLELTPSEALKAQTGYINGEKMTVKVIHSHRDIYPAIRTIMRDGVLIARRVKFGDRTILRLTGQGYTRPQRKQDKKGVSKR